MSDLVREVDEDVRRDQMVRFWKKFGPYIAIIIGVFLVAFAGWRYWSDQQEILHQEESKVFSEAATLFDKGEYADAMAGFSALAERAEGGYGKLARLNEATSLSLAGNMAEAAAIYDAVAVSEGDSLLGTFASLQAAFNLMDSATVEELQDRLRPLAVPGGAWFYSATEALAFVDIKAGDLASARINFSTIAFDTSAPRTLRGRAQQMLDILGSDISGDGSDAQPLEEATETEDAGNGAAADNPDEKTEQEEQGDSSQ